MTDHSCVTWAGQNNCFVQVHDEVFLRSPRTDSVSEENFLYSFPVPYLSDWNSNNLALITLHQAFYSKNHIWYVAFHDREEASLLILSGVYQFITIRNIAVELRIWEESQRATSLLKMSIKWRIVCPYRNFILLIQIVIKISRYSYSSILQSTEIEYTSLVGYFPKLINICLYLKSTFLQVFLINPWSLSLQGLFKKKL